MCVVVPSVVVNCRRRVPLLFQKETKHLHKLFDVLEKVSNYSVWVAVTEIFCCTTGYGAGHVLGSAGVPECVGYCL